jgi:hypothetical protein
MNRLTMHGGIALVLTAVLAMSGCANNSTTGGDTAGGGTTDTKPADTPKDATAALVDAAKKLQSQSFKSTAKIGDSATMIGVMDPEQKVGEFTMESTADGTEFKTEMRTIDGVNYIRITMPGTDLPGMDGKTWRKLNASGGKGTLGSYDPADTVQSLESATEVKWAGDNAVTGTIDLAKAGQQLGMGELDLSKITTKTIPFEAGFDGDGRLVKYSLTMPAFGSEPATKMDMTYSDFGVPVTVTAPAGSELAKG